MRGLLRQLPLMVILAGIGCAAMLIPAAHALALRDHDIARNFFYAGVLGLVLVALAGLATAGEGAAPGTARQARAHLLTMLGTFTLLPLLLAIPFNESVRDTGLFNAWWEMVSALTTTGATLYDPGRLAPSLHLWRALVGWMGGFFMLVTAISILAPLKIGGFEVMAAPGGREEVLTRLPGGRVVGRGMRLAPRAGESADAGARLMRFARLTAPIYAGITLALWVGLMIAGDPALVGLCHAMSTVSTSGITPVAGPVAGVLTGPAAPGLTAHSGHLGEALIALALVMALSRRLWPGETELLRVTPRTRDDPELRLAAVIVLAVPAVFFLRHFVALLESPHDAEAPWQAFVQAGRMIWAAGFTALSFLTTTGFEAQDFAVVRGWSGLSAPGLVLAGLAIVGGGVATTAGGVKLLRTVALMMHGRTELDRLIHPAIVPGGGRMARRLRSEGAYLAFIFFMLFAMAIAVVMGLIALTQLPFIESMMLAIAALSNTGPLAGVAGVISGTWAEIPFWAKPVLAGAMVVGRLETLAILALFNPELWRN